MMLDTIRDTEHVACVSETLARQWREWESYQKTGQYLEVIEHAEAAAAAAEKCLEAMRRMLAKEDGS